MSDGVAFLSMIVGFGFVIIAGVKLGAGSHAALTGLFATQGARDWPTGVQEADAPPFVLTRSSPSPVRTPASAAPTSAASDIPAVDIRLAEIEELYAGPIRSRH